jgi:hypothetical protein
MTTIFKMACVLWSDAAVCSPMSNTTRVFKLFVAFLSFWPKR